MKNSLLIYNFIQINFLIKYSQNFIISMPKLFICDNVCMLKWLFKEHGIYTNPVSRTPT